MLVRRMKPLDFSLEEMGDVLEVLDALEDAATDDRRRQGLLERLGMFREAALARVAALRDQLETAEGFADDLGRELARRQQSTGDRS
jgi:DNA-binding transcriptional MerR regulator